MFHVKQKKDEVKRCVMYCDDENEGGGGILFEME